MRRAFDLSIIKKGFICKVAHYQCSPKSGLKVDQNELGEMRVKATYIWRVGVVVCCYKFWLLRVENTNS